MNNSPEERKVLFVKEFKGLTNWDQRYRKLVTLGKELPPLASVHRVESNKIRGCQSEVWLWAELKNGLVHFSAESDASIAKGILALLLNIYNQASPQDILQLDQGFIDDIGLRQHLSPNRANGLSNMLKQILTYAFAFKTKMEMEKNVAN